MTDTNILDQAVRGVTTSRITRVLLLNDLPGAQSLIDAIRTRYREIVEKGL